mmetsp:Transcript_25257/g.37292  ORF Transcript_25257/g.37292 Transcript_25257/m.37292 type:complete len:176 (+) Transcript_25257:85-612(+)|eukprot:CAMPEP_0194211076 /NCGR_PEP_ID=MMETSP0156-20130528/9288_1 /TAXON_ID=33649 /ORGANISM="Thalassionema nitzschioides, Strain L26-B" /LENGTH=175 /DNA_ID=CAMNT_0038938505 /DNA_START=82 /DNA_END=609 /DNA_ORIENTATION=-
MPPYCDISELTIDAKWDKMCYTITDDEDIPPSEIPKSSAEVCKVLEEWTSDEEESVHLAIMEVDEEIGSDFLSDDLFGGVTMCPPPDVNTAEADGGIFGIEDESSGSSDLSIEEAMQNLSESMRRSQESRIALKMKTSKITDKYSRQQSVSEVLSSIEKSGMEINDSIFGTAAVA